MGDAFREYVTEIMRSEDKRLLSLVKGMNTQDFVDEMKEAGLSNEEIDKVFIVLVKKCVEEQVVLPQRGYLNLVKFAGKKGLLRKFKNKIDLTSAEDDNFGDPYLSWFGNLKPGDVVEVRYKIAKEKIKTKAKVRSIGETEIEVMLLNDVEIHNGMYSIESQRFLIVPAAGSKIWSEENGVFPVGDKADG